MNIEARKLELIQQILKLNSDELFTKLESIIKTEKEYILSEEQTEMLKMSEKDIEYGNLVSEDELKEIDSEWLS